ncbi:MAG TPA: hypothetical protein VJ206_03765 [bacterium]|nr:hypothetical protein [bacterium]
MAIEGIESFANLAIADLVLKYVATSAGSIQATAGRWGGPCLRFTAASNYCETLIVAATTVGQAVAVKFPASMGTQSIFEFNEGASIHVDIRINTTGTIFATRNGTTLGTSTNALTAGVWYHIEAKTTIHDTTGTVDVWVNGVNWLSLTGQDTRNAGAGTVTRIQLSATSNSTHDYSDWIVYSGSTGPLGDHRVGPKLPSTTGANSQWTPSAGSNYQCVDETAQNGDTDYVSEASAGDRDTYVFAALGLTGTVAAVQVNVWARKDDAGSRTVAPVIRRSAVNYDGTAASVLDSYSAVCKQVYETDPSTAAAWSVTNVDAAEFGQKLVS